jgi:hypothetical protein
MRNIVFFLIEIKVKKKINLEFNIDLNILEI